MSDRVFLFKVERSETVSYGENLFSNCLFPYKHCRKEQCSGMLSDGLRVDVEVMAD